MGPRELGETLGSLFMSLCCTAVVIGLVVTGIVWLVKVVQRSQPSITPPPYPQHPPYPSVPPDPPYPPPPPG